jgi:hypothetical protein
MICTGRGKKQAHLKVTWVVPKSICSYSTKVLSKLTCYHGGGAHIRFRLQLDTNVVEGHPITIDEVT